MQRSSKIENVRRGRWRAALGVLVAVMAMPVPHTASAATFECTDESNLCLEPTDGARWQPEEVTTKKDRARRSTKYAGQISLTIEGGRGSLFINGRYAGTAPLRGAEIPAGRNDIQVRDGAEILSLGVLTVPREGDLSITVRHP